MKTIALTQGQSASVDDADFDWLNQWKWFAQWDDVLLSYYARRMIYIPATQKQQSIGMHRQILGLEKGDVRQGDHINGNTLDNQRDNLRIVTSRGNHANLIFHRRGKLVGTTYARHAGRWVAQTKISGKKIHIGYFDTELEAHEAYKKYLAEHLQVVVV